MNGSRADFWRTVRLAKRLGWPPWVLEIQRGQPSPEFAGRAVQVISASRHGCHAGAGLWFETSVHPDAKGAASILRRTGGPGAITVRPGCIHVMRRMVSVDDAIRPHPRAKGGRARLSADRRADLIRRLLRWLRTGELQGWTAASAAFRRTRTFQAAGVKWSLFSDLFFARGEGLYWNNFLTSSSATRRTYSRLDREGYARRISTGLRRMGFRVRYAPPYGWAFDLNYPRDRRVLDLAPKLAQWRP